MSSIDDRIVQMKFDNAAFERGVSTTIGTLTKLTDKLKLTGAAKGLDDVQARASRFNLSGMDGAVTGISKKFLAMSTVALTALSNITNRAVNAGINIAKSLTIAPIMDGYKEYETNLNSIQTILSNTKASGATLKDVNNALQQLNHYSDKTIYNFSEMARNIGTFTAAGVDLKTSVNSIKGIANLAALSGSNSQQASTAMYQLSQAIAAGRVSLQDWNSVVNAGMGGATFQRALAQTAASMGTLGEGAVKLSGKMKNVTINGKSFRESITAKPGEQSWLTSKVLTNTLQQFTGDLSKAQLKAQGFNDAQIKAIQATAKNAQNAATKVKSITQLLDVARETVGSGWAQTWQIVFGNFKEARGTFTDASNYINGIINTMSKGRNTMLKDWKDLGGRAALIDTVKNAFKALQSVLGPIHEAFRDIFPATTGKQLFDLTTKIRDFFGSLIIGGKTADDLKRTFRGIFAILDIGKQVIGAIFHGIGQLFGAMGKGSGSVLNLTGNIGDFLVSLDETLKKSGFLTAFFGGLGRILSLPIKLIGALAGELSNLFGNFDISGIASKVGSAFGAITDAITGAFSTDNINASMSVFTAGLTGGIFLVLKRFIGRITTLFDGGIFGGGGMLDSIKNTFQTLTGSLKAMQTQIQAKTLLLIAGALALLTASVVAMSFIDGKALGKSLGALAAAFGELMAAMAILVKISGSAGFIKVPIIAASMVMLAGAIAILTGAIALMGQLSWTEIAKGLSGIAGALVAISVGMRLMPKGMIGQAAALDLLAIALNGIALAVAGLGLLSWEQIGKGLTAVAGALVVIAGAMRLMPTGMILQAAALVAIAAALDVMSAAIAGLGQLSWEEIAKGLVGIAGALLIIAGAMQLMPATLPITAAGLVLVGIALNGIGLAVIGMAQLGWEQIAQGLTALAGAMVILAIGLNLMSGTLLGSAALLAAAAALAVLTPVMIALGQMSWESIAKGLVAIAGALVIFAAAGILLGPAALGLIGLGAAVALFGGGLALAGAGTLAFAAALKVLAPAADTAANTIKTVIGAIISTIPKALEAFGKGIVAFAGAIAQGAPKFTKAFVAIMTSLTDAVVETTPKIVKMLNTLLDAMLGLLVRNVPKLVNAGMQLLLGLLQGISNNIGKIVNVVGDIITKFLNALGNQAGKIADAGAKLIIKFINAISAAIDAHSGELGAAAGRLGVAIVTGMAKGIAGAAGSVATAALNAAKGALDKVKGFLGIHSPSRVYRDEVGKQISKGMADGIWAGQGWVGQAILGVARNAHKVAKKQLPTEFEKLGEDLNKGFIKGLSNGADDVRKTFEDLAGDIKDTMASTKATVLQDRDALDRLLKEKKPDDGAIKKAKQKLADDQALSAAAQLAHTKYVKNLSDERAKLLDLGKQYDTLSEKIKNATQARDDAIAARDNANKSITDSFSALPDITDETTIADYTAGILSQADQTAAFLASLNSLSKMGLDDTTYQKFLDEGLGAKPFIDQLIAAGPDAVKAINDADAQLKTAAVSLGNTASKHLYQAGVDAAQGLLNGLKSQRAALQTEAESIARMIEDTIRAALDTHSPSKVMIEVGKDVNNGLAVGLSQYTGVVQSSASSVAETAIQAIKNTMYGLSKSVSGGIDVRPVITPVLDLTQVRRDASQLGGIMGVSPISASVSYGQASSISNARGAAQASKTNVQAQTASTVITLEQNNYSPKALSAVEIYRQTKNQLSLAKEALNA